MSALHVPGGTVVRYTETEPMSGRWSGRGSVERVMWRAVPDDPKVPISYHKRRRDAVESLRPEPDDSRSTDG